MIEDTVNPDSLVSLFSNAANSSQSAGKLLSIANILIPESWLPVKIQGKDRLPMAERVLIWFHQNGFLGDRTKMNLDGYPGLFRDLCSCPDWADHELFYRQSEKYGYDLLDIYRDSREKIFDKTLETAEELKYVLIESGLSALREKIDLVSILGSERTESLYWTIFEIDPDGEEVYDYRAKPGVPDLFIWHPDPQHQLWFFAEVKGPGDSLRHTQHEWFRENWEKIQKHILIITVA